MPYPYKEIPYFQKHHKKSNSRASKNRSAHIIHFPVMTDLLSTRDKNKLKMIKLLNESFLYSAHCYWIH